jgi:hypothetical protein
MISSFATEAASLMEAPRYIAVAQRRLTFFLEILFGSGTVHLIRGVITTIVVFFGAF